MFDQNGKNSPKGIVSQFGNFGFVKNEKKLPDRLVSLLLRSTNKEQDYWLKLSTDKVMGSSLYSHDETQE